MQYISSDTNVWLDFAIIERLELPFRLPCIYLMHGDAVHNELLSGIAVMGTIGVLERLYEEKRVDGEENLY